MYAALEATLVEHAAGRAAATVPVASMIQAPVASLEQRAASIIEAVSDVPGLTCVVGSGRSAIGGGTTPGLTLPSCVLVVHLEGATPDDLEAQLRGGSPHVIGRIERDEVRLDLRTVLPTEDGALVAALRTLADRR